MSNFLSQLFISPLEFFKKVFLKTIFLPLKYGKGQDYKAEDYWRDRFQKYNISIKGVGCEGLSEEENWKARQKVLKTLGDVCSQENIQFSKLRVLEVGCGSGFYATYLKSKGVIDFTGIDITNALFEQLKIKFPDYQFLQQDITTNAVSGQYDFVLMMDVIQHIVQEEKLLSALNHIRNCLKPGGLFIVAPLTKVSRRYLFHVHSWSMERINMAFGPDYVKKFIPFRKGDSLAIIKKQNHKL